MEEKVAKILPDDFCPCGSDKRFKDCCLNKGHTYGLFYFGEKQFAYDLDERTEYVRDLMAYCFQNIIRPYKDRKPVDIDEGLMHLEAINELHGQIMEPFLRHSSCQKGCAACCYHRVEATAIEAEMVRRYVAKHFDEEKKTPVISQIQKNAANYPPKGSLGKHYPEDLATQYAQRHIPCPFLSAERECNVYSARPIVCRICVAFSNPQECKTGKPHLAYYGEYFPQLFDAINCLSLLVFADLNYERHLMDWFLHDFKL